MSVRDATTGNAGRTGLSVADLVVDFGRRGQPGVRAVDHVSFDLTPGRTVALVGESGSGKSTVVRALGKLVRPTSGEVTLHGSPEGRARREYRRRVQVVFQDPFASLNPSFSVGHHLRRPLLIHGRARRADVDGAVADLLRSVNLVPPDDIARRRPHELSGGQRQRVAIARALAPDPDILLADEPVSMLDVSIRLEILNLLDRLKDERRLAMLYVTHDLATARHFSSDLMVMYQGQVVERGSSDDVILSPAHPYTQLLAAAAPRPRRRTATLPPATADAAGRGTVGEGRSPLGGRLEANHSAAERRQVVVAGGCRFRARCPHAMDVCATDPPELDVGGGHLARCWLHSPDHAGVGAGARRPPAG